jgi:integrase
MALPRHLAEAALFAVNTGCRDQEVCQLRWDWEVEIPELNTSVFILPETTTKTSTERVVVLNTIAQRVIEACRGVDREYVFGYRGKALYRLHKSGWKTVWRKAGLPVDKDVLRGVHNLRHTFGRRLRGAGAPLETRKLLLGHASGDITTHYSAQTPTLTVISRKNANVGKVSEKEKRVSGE